MRLQRLFIDGENILDCYVLGIAAGAGVDERVGGELRQLLFLDADFAESLRNADSLGQRAHGVDSGERGLLLGQALGPDAHSPCDVAVLLHFGGHIVLHYERQEQSVCHAVSDVIACAERMRHRVNDAESHVGERHTRNVAAHSHALASLGILAVESSCCKVFGNHFDTVPAQKVGKRVRALGDIALDCVRERVHTGSRGQALGHAGHHFGVVERDYGNIVGVDANKLSACFLVGYDVVNRDFCRRTGSGCERHNRERLMLRVGNALQRAHVVEIGIGSDNADSLCRIDYRAAADSDDYVGRERLEFAEPSSAAVHQRRCRQSID